MTNRSEIEALATELATIVVPDNLNPSEWRFDREDLHELARRLQPARVPEGCVMVPREPTPEMVEAARVVKGVNGVCSYDTAMRRLRAGIATAPAPEVVKADLAWVPAALQQTRYREDDPEEFGRVRGWNACRDAVLAAILAAESEQAKLVTKWREENGDYPESKRDCADELESALRRLASAQQAGIQVVGWIYEDELPSRYPYDEILPYSKVDVVRMFPVFAPTRRTGSRGEGGDA